MIIEELKDKIEEKHHLINSMRNEINKVLVGQRDLIDGLLMGLFTKGHILIEGVPGLAKTSAVKALAATVRAEFKRIQFTPDLSSFAFSYSVAVSIFGPRHPDLPTFIQQQIDFFVLFNQINQEKIPIA